MSITEVDRMWSRSTATTESKDGQSFKAQFADAYDVVHSNDETRVNILKHPDVPKEGDLYIEEGQQVPGVYCIRRSLEKGLVRSFVLCQFEGEYSDGDILQHPINKPPEISRSNRLVNAEIDADFYGMPLTNSVGDPVEGLTTDISDFAIRIKRNFQSIDMYAIRAYLRSHNSDEFDGWPPGTARFRSFTADEKLFQGTTYHEVTALIEFREPYNTTPERAWYLRYRNEGMRVMSGVQVNFTGGGGSGATARAVTSGGGISAVVVTNGGTGYTSPPTVSFTTQGTPAGSGAVANSSLNTDLEVQDVEVTSAGTNYHARLVKAVDGQKEPVSKPVMLAADGTRLENNNNAVWIERPVSGALPYSNLGLL